MNSHRKTLGNKTLGNKTLVIATLVVTALGASSALALKSMRDASATPTAAAEPLFTAKFAGGDRMAESDCMTHSWTLRPASFTERWFGFQRPADRGLNGFVWTACAEDGRGGVGRGSTGRDMNTVNAAPPSVR